MKKEMLEHGLNYNRRRFLSRLSLGIGSVALGSLLIPDLFGKDPEEAIIAGLPRFAPKAKRVIYLFQNGAPSQLDLFDYKPTPAKDAWPGSPGKHTHGPAFNRYDQRPGAFSPGRFRFPVWRVWTGKSTYQ